MKAENGYLVQPRFEVSIFLFDLVNSHMDVHQVCKKYGLKCDMCIFEVHWSISSTFKIVLDSLGASYFNGNISQILLLTIQDNFW
jgi:hypothetical protein